MLRADTPPYKRGTLGKAPMVVLCVKRVTALVVYNGHAVYARCQKGFSRLGEYLAVNLFMRTA